MDSFHLLSVLPYPEKQYLVNEQCDRSAQGEVGICVGQFKEV